MIPFPRSPPRALLGVPSVAALDLPLSQSAGSVPILPPRPFPSPESVLEGPSSEAPPCQHQLGPRAPSLELSLPFPAEASAPKCCRNTSRNAGCVCWLPEQPQVAHAKVPCAMNRELKLQEPRT